MVKKYEIFDEDTFFSLLEQCNSDEGLPDGCQIEFVGWPQFELTIRGEQFDGGVPTRIMPGLLKLQRRIDTAYANIVYGDGRKLSKKERKTTELIVRFEAGRSTTFLSDLWPAFNNMMQQAVSKMDGNQALLAVFATVGTIGGVWAWKSYLQKRTTEKKLEFKLEMGREETKRQQIIADALQKSQMAWYQAQQNLAFQDQTLKLIKSSDALIVGDTVIDGDTARKIVSKPRPDVLESRMDGQFIILTVDSGSVRGGFKLKVRNIEGGNDVTVDVPEGTLSPEQVDILQRGEWGKRPLTMRINTRKAGNRLIGATLINAGLEEVHPHARGE